MKIIAYFIAFLLSVSLFFACNDDDKFSTDSNLRLNFSADTVHFDTVFATIGTATKRLKIYNRNKDAITINTVQLMRPSETGFRINVDGESGNTISNVDILGKDSLYIFVEVTVNPLNQNNPLLITDSIHLQFNGVSQYIRLEAIGQDVILWKGKIISEDTTLSSEKPYLIYDSLHVKNGATLHIKKNTQLYFHDKASLSVSGRISAVGTMDQPITFRGDRTDNIFESPKLSYDRVPGQWYGIKLASESYGNRFENVRIRNGIYGVKCLPADAAQTKVTFLNTVIQNTSQEILSAVNAKIDAQNSLFANAGTYTVHLTGGSYNFLHCTITNYMSYSGLMRKGTFYMSDDDGSTIGNSQFINTIITGSGNSNNEIKIETSGNTASNYTFINCLLRVPEISGAQFVNTVWNEDPAFKYIYQTGDAAKDPNLYFLYNFDLSESSKAINKGSREYAAELPSDLRGVSRRSDEAPDIGCFEWKAN